MRISPSLAALVLLIAACGSNPNPVQILTIGNRCSVSAECGTVPHFVCQTELTGGSCSAHCNLDGECPTEAICIDGDGPDGGLCQMICDTDNQCRVADNFRCVARELPDLTFVPPPPGQDDGGMPIVPPPINAIFYCNGALDLGAPADLAVPDAGAPADLGNRG